MKRQSTNPVQRAVFQIPVLAVCILAWGHAGCVGGRTDTGFAPSTIQIVWPPPPARARIQFVRIVQGAGGLPLRRSRLARALVGRRKVSLSRPYGVSADEEGRLFVADTDAPAALVYDYPRRRLIRVTGFNGRKLASPIGIAPGPRGTFYVTDSVLRKILLFDRDGAFIREFSPGTSLKRPTGIAIEPGSGRVLVVDTLAGSVLVFSPDGKLLRTIGAGGNLYRPTDVSCDAKGRVFVTDTLNFRVQIFQISDGAFRGTFGVLGDGSGTLRDPRGVAVDRYGHVYLVDRAFSNIQIFDDRGRFLLAFGEPGTGPGQFDMPSDIFIDQSDRIYVSDSFNGRVQVFRFLGDEE